MLATTPCYPFSMSVVAKWPLAPRHFSVTGALALHALGCSKPSAAPEPAHARAPTEVVTAGARASDAPIAPLATSSTSVPPATPNASPCTPDTPPAELSTLELTKIHSGPVLSAAVGTPPRVALWSGRVVTLFEGAKARELPAPRLPPGAVVELFFGRDDQPRLMGFVPGEPGKEVPVYLRFRHGEFRPEPSELGPLGAPRGALYGVLGFADPEVVCRPRELCLVKRTTGWKRVPAHERAVPLVLRNGAVFALHSDHVERLRDGGWTALEPARSFEQPLDVAPTANGELWVLDRSAASLFRLKAGSWEPVVSPVSEPGALFARSEHSLLVVGKNGVAELDGTRFRCVRGVSGPLQLAFAVGNEVWVAGESGAYRSGH